MVTTTEKRSEEWEALEAALVEVRRVIDAVKGDPDLKDEWWSGYLNGLKRAADAIKRARGDRSTKPKAKAKR